jgi:transposase
MSKSKSISTEDKTRIILSYEEGKDRKSITKVLKIEYSSVCKIIKNYQQKGTLVVAKGGGAFNVKLKEEHKNKIRALLDQNLT